MSAVATNPQPSTTAAAPSSLAAVPRAIWIALGALGLATAGLTGAFVMRAVDGGQEPTSAQVSMQTAPTKVAGFEQQQQPAQVQPSNLQAAPQQQPEPVAKAAPAPVAKPKPVAQKPAPVQQASGSAGAPQVVAQAPVQQPVYTTPVQQRAPAVCTYCGTVENVQEIREKGEGSGLGAVGGAVVGGLLGNQVGGGNGKKVMTVVGAAGGALAGHQIEKHARGTTVYDVQVRMEDGSVRTFRRAEPVQVGTRVTVDGNTLRVRGSQSGGGVPATPAPRTLQTSGPALYGN